MVNHTFSESLKIWSRFQLWTFGEKLSSWKQNEENIHILELDGDIDVFDDCFFSILEKHRRNLCQQLI